MAECARAQETQWMKDARVIIEEALTKECRTDFTYDYDVNWGTDSAHLVFARLKTGFLRLRGHEDYLLIFNYSRNSVPPIYNRLMLRGPKVAFIKKNLRAWEGRGSKPHWKDRTSGVKTQ